MNNIVEEIKKELLIRCEQSKEKNGYDFWNNHIKYVVNNAVELAHLYGADVEIVELGALLHDIAMPSDVGDREEHHINGSKIADELLTKLHYPQDRIERVKRCVLNHRASQELPRTTIEEECVADADVMAHFDNIADLFSLAYRELDLNTEDGKEYVKKKLERDYHKLSERTRNHLTEMYQTIIEILFGE